MICNKSEDYESLFPYINKPVYIKGYRWGKTFDGWTVIYDVGSTWLHEKTLSFDYRGHSYSVFGFLPSRFTSRTDSSFYNAFYTDEGEVKR